MRFIYIKKQLSALLLSGMIVLTVTGCQTNRQVSITDSPSTTSLPIETPEVEIEATTPSPEEKDDIIYQTFVDMTDKVNEYTTAEAFDNMKDKAKDLFCTGVDFVFYGTAINGITFDELTETGKLKVMNALLKIDEKIADRNPDYKENLGEHYQYFKNKILEKGEQLSDKIGDTIGEENWNEIKEACSDIKDIGGGIWDATKEAASNGTQKVKDWYQEFHNR